MKLRVSLALVCVLAVSGCMSMQASSPESALDGAGMTESEVMEMSLEEQYALAGERHRDLNERFAKLQAEIYGGEWREGATRSEVIPGSGHMLAPGMRGVTRDNTYYFTVSRSYFPDREVAPLIREVANSWETRGWNVTEETRSPSGRIRVFFTTDDGFWFELDRTGDHEVGFTAHTPVYWGDNLPLLEAAADRRDAEDAAGAPWDTTDLDEQGYAYRLPGAYRPFPAWDALPEDTEQ